MRKQKAKAKKAQYKKYKVYYQQSVIVTRKPVKQDKQKKTYFETMNYVFYLKTLTKIT